MFPSACGGVAREPVEECTAASALMTASPRAQEPRGAAVCIALFAPHYVTFSLIMVMVPYSLNTAKRGRLSVRFSGRATCQYIHVFLICMTDLSWCVFMLHIKGSPIYTPLPFFARRCRFGGTHVEVTICCFCLSVINSMNKSKQR